MRNIKIIKYLQLYMCFIIYSFALVFSKIASMQMDVGYTVLFFGGEVVVLGLYAVIWQQVLKVFPLVVAMANKGITIIFGLLWSVLLFDEQVTLWNILGAGIIIAGIWMVSMDE